MSRSANAQRLRLTLWDKRCSGRTCPQPVGRAGPGSQGSEGPNRTYADLYPYLWRVSGRTCAECSAERVTGIEPACPAWEVQKWEFTDQAKSEKYLIKCRVGYPALPTDIRRSPWRWPRTGGMRRVSRSLGWTRGAHQTGDDCVQREVLFDRLLRHPAWARKRGGSER